MRPQKAGAVRAAGEKITVSEVILERQFSRTPRSGSPGVALLGLDLGSQRTALAASRDGQPIEVSRDILPSVVGSPKPGVVVAGVSRFVFGNDALKYSEHVKLTWPVRGGVVHDMEICRKLVDHVRSRVDPTRGQTMCAVVSTPADSTPGQRSRARQVMLGVFERVFLVPEPFLAAVGMLRDPSLQSSRISTASALSSLVVDIGERSTRLCLWRGDFPGKDDQVRVERGGSFIDDQVLSASHMHFGLRLSSELLQSIKQEQGIPLYGAVRTRGEPNTELLDLVVVMREAYEQLLAAVVDGIQELVGRCDAGSLSELTENVLLTGRSSRIPGMDVRLKQLLKARGLGKPRVLVPSDHERLVARGALHVAEALGEEEWETAEEEQRRQDREVGDDPYAEFRQETVEAQAEPEGQPVDIP